MRAASLRRGAEPAQPGARAAAWPLTRTQPQPQQAAANEPPLTLAALRRDFERRTNRSMSMPIAGLVVWTLVGLAGLVLPLRAAVLVMVAATGAIFPIALAVARLRGEALVSNPNALARLMGLCIVMVNLLWAVHLPLMAGAADYVPLTLGIALGLHWVVYSWIVQHRVGLVHAILRTGLVLGAWLLWPQHRVAAVAGAVVIAYAVSLAMMARRHVDASD